MEFDLSPLWISLKTVLTATLIAFFLGITAARKMINYQGKAKGLIDGLLTLPLVLPPTVVGFFLLVLFGKNSWLGQLLYLLGVNVIFSWTGTVIAATVVAFPLMYKTSLGAFKQIDQNLIYAARTLGVTEGTIFWRIIFPLAWQGILGGVILAFARALGEFGATLMLAGNIPGQTQTIPLAIFFAAEGGKMGQALIWVLAIVGVSLAVVTTLNYLSEERQVVRNRRFRNLRFLSFRFLSFRFLNFRFLNFRFLNFRFLNLRFLNLRFLNLRFLNLRFLNLRFLSFIFANLRFGIANLSQITQRYFRNHSSFARRQIPQKSPAFLEMDILKQNPGFTLSVEFTTDNNPLGILGGSGSGKSMTLGCLAGLQTPTAGRIVLNGRVLFDSERGINLPTRKRRIGFLFQNYALFPHMNVKENIAFGLQYGRYNGFSLSKAELNQRVAEKIALVELQGLENRYPRQLSGGQQQRVALARALAIEPEALLLDEPFSALDAYLRSRIEKQLSEILATYQGITLFVTHNLEEAYRVCKNILVFSEGRIIADGCKTEIFEHPQTLPVAQVTQCKNFSRVRAISPTQVEALDWGCTLQVIEPIPSQLAYVGIRAHHLIFAREENQENCFRAWVAQTSETPHRMTVYLKLHSPPNNSKDYHLQAEVYKEKWASIKDNSCPWWVCLDPLRLLLLRDA